MCKTLFSKFLCRCFSRLKKTSRNYLLVGRFVEEMLYVSLFTFLFNCRSFSPWWPLAVLFSHRRYKIFMFSSNEISLRCHFFFFLLICISRSSSFSAFHDNADTKMLSKEILGFAVDVVMAPCD